MAWLSGWERRRPLLQLQISLACLPDLGAY